MVNSPLIRPYFLGGGSFGGGTLHSHDFFKTEELNEVESIWSNYTDRSLTRPINPSKGGFLVREIPGYFREI